MAAQKINEAHEHIAKAEKCLKTSMTKWKPDYDEAASEMAKAAVAFKNAKQFEQAKDAYLKEAEYHTDNKALFHAAKAYEQAGMMLKDMKKMPEAIQLIEKASIMYVENGTSGTAGIALDRAGKLIEPIDLEKAVDLYQKAASVFENEDRLRQAAELLGKSSRLLVRLRRCLFFNIFYTLLILSKIFLFVFVFINDNLGGNICTRHSLYFQNSSNHAVALSIAVFWSVFVQYAKLAISLRVPGGGGGKKKKSPVAPQGGSAGLPPAKEDDDYEGGLC
uniref:Gamma-soluble NSF attachment protein n=1 Tax=Sinocyclocheilus grahami TaxID=75366 RepID=A0A672L9U4_SINGR